MAWVETAGAIATSYSRSRAAAGMTRPSQVKNRAPAGLGLYREDRSLALLLDEHDGFVAIEDCRLDLEQGGGVRGGLRFAPELRDECPPRFLRLGIPHPNCQHRPGAIEPRDSLLRGRGG